MSGAATRRVALVLEYEGTAYAGSQAQANAPTVQAEVERAVEALTGERRRLRLAGRTDAGAHAAGQVAAFDTHSDLPAARFRSGLNHHLPDDIAVVAAHDVTSYFDPRRDAVSRTYRYTFLERDARSPLRRSVHVAGRKLDIDAMAGALAHLRGERDFAPFSGALAEDKSTVRRLYRAEVWRAGDEVHIEFEANAFLPQQVRRTAAAVLQVGLGKMTLSAFEALADSGTRGAAEQVLPAAGLCLRRVTYHGFPPHDGWEAETEVTGNAAAANH